MKILLCVEGQDGSVDPLALELVAAARKIAAPDDEVVALVAEDLPAGEVLGEADRVLVAKPASGDMASAAGYAEVLFQAVRQEQPEAILIAYTSLGLDLAPDLAARTGYALVSYVTDLDRQEGSILAESQIYGGKLLADTETPLPSIFMINPGRFPGVPASPLSAERMVGLAVDGGGAAVRLLGRDLPEGVVNLAEAERIVCVGRGIGDEDNIELAQELASLLDAEVAGSRPVVDSGWLPKARQVGKSGQTVKPKLYIALGVSGAPEHLEGMAGSELIIAVNSDPEAPIFEVAHYGSTCDLFDLLPLLSEGLRSVRAK